MNQKRGLMNKTIHTLTIKDGVKLYLLYVFLDALNKALAPYSRELVVKLDEYSKKKKEQRKFKK